MARNRPKQKEPGRRANLKLVFFIITGLAAFFIYANSLNNDFVFDDDSVVLGDPTITDLSNIPKYFTGDQGFHKVIGRYYRPVVSASYAIDYALWGFKPFGFHLTNILIHILNSLLFLKLLLMMFVTPAERAGKQDNKFKEYFILFGALIFAIHPIHTEAVAWVSGRTDSLSCTFFFAAFIYYLKYSEENNTRNLALLLLFYLLSLLAKEMAITLPAVIILYDWIVKRYDLKKMISEKLVVYSSLIALSLLYMLLRWWVLSQVPERTTYNYFFGKDLAVTIFTMLQTVPLYFRLAFVPYDMLYHYSGYMPYRDSFFIFPVLYPVIFILVMLAAAFYLRKRLPVLSYAIFFFFVTLIPVLNIVPTMNFMADRFLYIPSVVMSLAFIAIVFRYYKESNINIIYSVAAIITIGFLFLTISRNADWKTNDTLFLSAEDRPGTVTYVNIGNIYANKQEYDKAEIYYRKAVDLRKETVLANNNLGKIFMVKQNYDSAQYYMYQAYLLDTLSPEPMHSLAQLNAAFDKLPEAIQWLERIQRITPGYMNSDKMLTDLKTKQQLGTQSKLDPEMFKTVAALEQSSYKNYQEKKYDQSIKELSRLADLNPSGRVGYYNNIGMCYLESARYKEAIKYFELSLKERPDFSSAYNNLGDCYDKLGDKKKAIENYNKALQVDPNNQNAKKNLEKLSLTP